MFARYSINVTKALDSRLASVMTRAFYAIVARVRNRYSRDMYGMRRGDRGVGLASVFFVALILTTLLTILVGANSSTLAVIRHSEATLEARRSAQSLLARATYELRQSPGFGVSGESLEFQPTCYDSGEAYLTFDSDEAKKRGIPASVNNLSSDESIKGPSGELIPARTARIYSVGDYCNERRTVVMDFHVPPYPYAIATAGSFESMGDLTLKGLSPETGQDVPGHLVSNSQDDKSMVLGPRTEITGDLVSAGGIVLAKDDVEVGGEVKSRTDASEIPRIPLSDFDPRNMTSPGNVTTLGTSFLQDPKFEGKVLREGDLAISGDMNLDGALLFVEGDLEIVGNLTGRGAIVTTGKLTITGTQNVTTDNELAILVGGDLAIQGKGVNSSKLEGLIYAEGDVMVSDSTIEGTLISQSNGGTIPRVLMERSSMIHNPESTSLVTTVGGTDPGASLFLAFGSNGLYEPGLNVTTDSGATASADSSPGGIVGRGSKPPVGKASSAGAALMVGVSVDSNGTYHLYPPDGSAMKSSKSEWGVLLQLAGIILKEMPELKESKAWLERGELGGAVKELTSDLKALASSPPVVEAQVKTSAAAPSSNSFELEIDPMKFLKYGEEMRIRSIRVVETVGAGVL